MFQRILAPLDGSSLAEKSLPYVESMAKQYDAEVILGWVVPLRTYAVADFQPLDYGMATILDTNGEKAHAAEYLQRIQARLQKQGIRVSLQIVDGYSISDAIVAMANEAKADLIIKTTYARLGPSRWLQGNIAAAVMQRAPCPLFLVRVSGEGKHDEALQHTARPVEYS